MTHKLRISNTNINGLDEEKLKQLENLANDDMDIIMLAETHYRDD